MSCATNLRWTLRRPSSLTHFGWSLCSHTGAKQDVDCLSLFAPHQIKHISMHCLPLYAKIWKAVVYVQSSRSLNSSPPPPHKKAIFFFFYHWKLKTRTSGLTKWAGRSLCHGWLLSYGTTALGCWCTSTKVRFEQTVTLNAFKLTYLQSKLVNDARSQNHK